MSFIIDNLTNVRGQDKAQRVQGKWMYRTTDARATVEAADYFLTAYTLVPSTDTKQLLQQELNLLKTSSILVILLKFRW